MKHFVLITLAALLLTACESIPRKRVAVDSLLNHSSEEVSFAVSSHTSIDALESWVSNDAPTRALVVCPEQERLCQRP